MNNGAELYRKIGERKTGTQMRNDARATKRCPKCGRTYQGYPSTSRVDNKTKICTDCGIVEALNAFQDHGMKPYEEQTKGEQ